MEKIGLDELKKIQLEILDELHHYCLAENLTYFLSSGTLIGAVRHKGYIPWDDDIDLYMPRESYERFLFNYKDPTGRYKVNEVRSNEGFTQSFIKMEDTHTLLVNPKAVEKKPLGINIDVFPIDFVSDNNVVLYTKFYLKKWLYNLSTAKSTPLSALSLYPSASWRMFVRMSRLLPFSASQINKFIIRMVKRTRPAQRVCNIAGNGPLKVRGCFAASSIASSVDIEFEGKQYKTMVGYRDYLSHTYGDYMKLPPVEQRIPSHQGDAYIK